MSGINTGVSQPLNIPSSKPVERKTTLEKAGDVVKANTQKGTLVGDHYVAVGAGTLIGGVAAVSGAIKLGNAVPAIDMALHAITSKGTGAVLSLGASGVLAEDAVKSFKDGKTVKGLAESSVATVAGLGGVELAGKQLNIKYADRALSATGEFIGKNSMAIVGGVSTAGGAYFVKEGVKDLKHGDTVKGSAKVAGGTVGVLGGVELVGRQFDIPVAKEALTGIPRRIFNGGLGLKVAGAAVAAAGVGAGVDGVRRMTTGKGIANDAIGTAEVTAATTAVTGGISIIGVAANSEKLKAVFPKNVDMIGGVALGASSVALAKHTVNTVKEKGITVGAAATGTASVITGLGAVQVVGSKLGVEKMNRALSAGWQPAVAAGLGVAAYKLGKDAIVDNKENTVNRAGKAAGAVVLGGASAAIAGKVFNIPVLNTMGENVLTTAGRIASPVLEFAVKNPGKTLTAVAIAGGVGTYMYYQNKK